MSLTSLLTCYPEYLPKVKQMGVNYTFNNDELIISIQDDDVYSLDIDYDQVYHIEHC